MQAAGTPAGVWSSSAHPAATVVASTTMGRTVVRIDPSIACVKRTHWYHAALKLRTKFSCGPPPLTVLRMTLIIAVVAAMSEPALASVLPTATRAAGVERELHGTRP